MFCVAGAIKRVLTTLAAVRVAHGTSPATTTPVSILARETLQSVSSCPFLPAHETELSSFVFVDPPGVYMVDGQLSTYQQSQGAAPTPHAAGASYNCEAVATVGGAAAAYT